MKQHIIERMLYITLALVFISAAVALYFATQAVEKFTEQQNVLQQQVSGQKEVLKGMRELLDNQGQTTKDINKSLSCILVFFGSPDRANFYISDLETCTITNAATGDTKILKIPQTRASQAQPRPARPGTERPTQRQNSPQQPPSSLPSQPQPQPQPQPNTLTQTVDSVGHAVKSIIDGVSHLLGGK